MTRSFLVMVLVVSVSSAVVAGQKAKAPSDNYDELVAKYLAAARQQHAGAPPEAGAWMNGLMGDPRARHVNDLVTVHVQESMTASGTADSSLSKKSSATAGVPSVFGLEGKLPGFITPADLLTAGADTGFKGAGTTTRAGQLSAVITARVAEVLPNGDLVLEGVREVEINGDRQVVVLTGIARVADVGPGNVLPSPAIGQLRIRYFGKGLIKDSLSPGWLVRFLNKIF
ncbi:MAG: flagellar basal body L-ring protein FlgH [Vicinamibacterales bacterium]